MFNAYTFSAIIHFRRSEYQIVFLRWAFSPVVPYSLKCLKTKALRLLAISKLACFNTQ